MSDGKIISVVLAVSLLVFVCVVDALTIMRWSIFQLQEFSYGNLTFLNAILIAASFGAVAYFAASGKRK